MRPNTRLTLSAAALSAFVALAPAKGTETFSLEDRILRVLIDSSAGGMTDTQTRILLEYMEDYLPGDPAIVAQNRGGAIGMRALEYVAQIDPTEELVFMSVSSSLPFDARRGLVDDRLYDPETINWVGSFRGSAIYCVFSTESGIVSIDDLAERDVTMATASASGRSYNLLWISNGAFGWNFVPVAGYGSTPEMALAVARGEVDGLCSNYSTYQSMVAPLVEDGDAHVLFYMDNAPRDDIDALYLPDVLAGHEGLEFYQSAFAAMSFDGPYAVPAGADPGFVAVIREAFAAAVADPDFREAADELGLDVVYKSGEELAETANRIANLPDELIEQMQALIPN